MENKRILHVSKYYPPYFGGIEYVCYKIVSSQPQYEHEVICFNDGAETTTDTYEGVRVVRVGTFGRVAGQPLSGSYYFCLRDEIRRFAPDIVHFHAPNPLVGCYLLPLLPRRTRLIVHYHAEILTSSVLYGGYRFFERRLFRRADRIIATSPNVMNEAEPLRHFRDKCTVIENTVSTEELDLRPSDAEAVERIRARYGHRRIVFAFGRHVPYKGLDRLIEADSSITSDCEIVIGGKGPVTEELRRRVRSGRVHFVGRIPDDELRCYLHAADVFAFPSLTRAEAFGIALAQAMYCGLPAVTFTIPASGVNYVSPGGVTGLEVPNGDTKAFAAALDRLLSDDTLRERMGRAARERIEEHFTIGAVAGKITGLYDSLL